MQPHTVTKQAGDIDRHRYQSGQLKRPAERPQLVLPLPPSPWQAARELVESYTTWHVKAATHSLLLGVARSGREEQEETVHGIRTGFVPP